MNYTKVLVRKLHEVFLRYCTGSISVQYFQVEPGVWHKCLGSLAWDKMASLLRVQYSLPAGIYGLLAIDPAPANRLCLVAATLSSPNSPFRHEPCCSLALLQAPLCLRAAILVPLHCQSLQYGLLGRSSRRQNPRKLTYLPRSHPLRHSKLIPIPHSCCCCFQRFYKYRKGLKAARSCCLNSAPQRPTAAAAPFADTNFAAEPSVQFSHQLLIDGCINQGQVASATCWSPDGEGTWIRGALCPCSSSSSPVELVLSEGRGDGCWCSSCCR